MVITPLACFIAQILSIHTIEMMLKLLNCITVHYMKWRIFKNPC